MEPSILFSYPDSDPTAGGSNQKQAPNILRYYMEKHYGGPNPNPYVFYKDFCNHRSIANFTSS